MPRVPYVPGCISEVVDKIQDRFRRTKETSAASEFFLQSVNSLQTREYIFELTKPNVLDCLSEIAMPIGQKLLTLSH